MTVQYTYGNGTTITVKNTGSESVYVYNWDIDGNKIIPIAGSGYVQLAPGVPLAIVLPALTPANAATYQSAGLFFSQSRLSQSLEQGRQPDIGNSAVDGGIPFSVWEYAYKTPGQYGGGLNVDFTAVDAFSYPIQWGVTDPDLNNGHGGSYLWGLGGGAQYNNTGAMLSPLDLLRAWMAATPFVNPSTGVAASANATSNLVWTSSSIPSLKNNRIVGPSKLWNYFVGGASKLPSFFPSSFDTFVTTYPYNGTQLAQAGAFGSVGASSPANNAGWQVITPQQKGGPGIDNGYSYALQKTAAALNGITPDIVTFQNGLQRLPNQGSGGFQGFYTYPQENVLGGITYLADQILVTVNVGPLSSSSTIGTGDRDVIIGTAASDVISGGIAGDVLIGHPNFRGLSDGAGVDGVMGRAGDVYLYLRADSSSPGVGHRDRIIGFYPNDLIHLGAIDANMNQAGHQGFEWIGSETFTGVAGELRFQSRSPRVLLLQGDLDGDREAEFEVLLQGAVSFDRSNLVLA